MKSIGRKLWLRLGNFYDAICAYSEWGGCGLLASLGRLTAWRRHGESGLGKTLVRKMRFAPVVDHLEARQMMSATVYVNDDWASYTSGAMIADADPTMAGDQGATFGTDAFGTITAGLSGVSSGGVVKVNAGSYGEAVNVNVAAAVQLLGNVTIDSLAGTSSGSVDVQAATLTLGNSQNTTFSGILAGTGCFTKVGTGTFTLAGTSANTFTGTTTVGNGTLELGKTNGVASIAGPVTIGDGSGAAASAILKISANEQIADTVVLTLAGTDGQLFSNSGTTETITPLTTDFHGGEVRVAGTLITSGDYVQSSGAGTTTMVTGGTLHIGSTGLGNFILASGKLQGAGTLQVTQFQNRTGGTIDPGIGTTDAGTLTILGNLYQGDPTLAVGSAREASAGIIHIDVGTTSGVNHFDRIVVGSNPNITVPPPSDSIGYYTSNGTVLFRGTLDIGRLSDQGTPTNLAEFDSVMSFAYRRLDEILTFHSRLPSDFTAKMTLIDGDNLRYEPRFLDTANHLNGESVSSSTTGFLSEPSPTISLYNARKLTLTALNTLATFQPGISATRGVNVTNTGLQHLRHVVTIVNNTSADITGPVYLEVSNPVKAGTSIPLTGVKLFNSAGKTLSASKEYVVVSTGAASWAVGTPLSVELDWFNPKVGLTSPNFTYTSRVLTGGFIGGTDARPEITSLTVSGGTPKPNNLVTASVAAHDADPSDTVTLAYDWYANGLLVKQTSTANLFDTIDLSTVANGTHIDSFFVNVTPSDGTAAGTLTTVSNAAPVGANDTYAIMHGELCLGNVLTNDTDAENHSLTATLFAGPSHGTLFLNSDGTFHYQPELGYVGSDTFAYVAWDSTLSSSPTSVTINLQNSLPVANADSASTSGSAIAIYVLANDMDPNNDPLSITSVTSPSNGTAYVSGSLIIYTPSFGTSVSADSFTYSINDGYGGTATTTVNVTLINDEPTVQFSTATVSIGEADGMALLTVNLSAFSNQIVSVHYSTTAGTASEGTDYVEVSGDLVFAPGDTSQTFAVSVLNDSAWEPQETLSVSLSLSSNSTLGSSATTLLTIIDDDASGAGTLVAVDDSFTVAHSRDLIGLDFTVNDMADAGNANRSWEDVATVIQTYPQHGSFYFSGASSAGTYVPDRDFVGTDTITYWLIDASGNSNIATVSISVTNMVPTGIADSFTLTDGNEPYSINVAANDSDGDQDFMSFSLSGNPAHGTLDFASNGVASYLPDFGYVGSDFFEYRIDDGVSTSEVVRVDLSIQRTGPAPVADVFSDIPSGADFFSLLSVLSNDAVSPEQNATVWLASDVSHGELLLRPTGEFVYRATPGFIGADSFQYYIWEEGLQSAAVTVTLQVAAFPASLTLADSYAINANRPLLVATPGVLQNDPIWMDVLTRPSVTLGLVRAPRHGSLWLEETGAFRYEPDHGFIGIDNFCYQVFVADVAVGAPTEVQFQIGNNAPVANADTFQVAPGSASSGTIVGNDFDLDGDTLWVHLVSGPTHGFLSIETSGEFSYIPRGGFVGDDTFVYQVFDGSSSSPVTNVTFHVINGAPQPLSDAYSLEGGTTLNVFASQGLLANDIDPDNQALSVTMLSSPANGRLHVSIDGSFSYTPNEGFTGTDSFLYQAFDGTMFSPIATVTLTVTSATLVPGPQSVGESMTISANSSVSMDVLGNDADPMGESLQSELLVSANHGTVSLNQDGTLFYTPTPGYVGDDSITYQVRAGVRVSSPNTISIHVVPDTFEVNSDSYVLAAGNSFTVNASDGILANDGASTTSQLHLVSGPTSGTLLLNPSGAFTYRPNAGYVGQDAFVYQLFDGFHFSSPTTVSMVVQGPSGEVLPSSSSNAVASGSGDSFVAQAGFSLAPSMGVLENDQHPDGRALRARLVTSTAHGALLFQEDGHFTYTAVSGFLGEDEFTYQPIDDFAVGTPVKVVLSVAGVSATSLPDAFAVVPGDNAYHNVLNNDLNPHGGSLSARLVTGPLHGRLFFNGDGSFRYQPGDGFYGDDSFTYVARNAAGDSAPTQVELSVLTGPPGELIARPDVFINTSGSVWQEFGVSSNDLVREVSAARFELVAGVNHGSLVFNSDGSFQYRPMPGFTGSDSFQYRLVGPGLASTPTDVALIVLGTLPNALNATYGIHAGMTLSESINLGIGNAFLAHGELLTTVSHGTMVFQSSGYFTYVPAPGFVGQDTFQYRVANSYGTSDAATVNIFVSDTAPQANHDTYLALTQVNMVANGLEGVLGNDWDADWDAYGDRVNTRLMSGPAHGRLLINPDGTFRYSTQAQFVGEDSFTYQGFSNGAYSEPITVRLSTSNRPPQGGANAFLIQPNQRLTGNVTIANSGVVSTAWERLRVFGMPVLPLVLSPVTTGTTSLVFDPENSPLKVFLLSPPQHGRLSLSESGTFVYDPNGTFATYDQFTYRLYDGVSWSEPVPVTIYALNAAPIGEADTFFSSLLTDFGAIDVGNVLANDTDPDGNSLEARPASPPTGGRLTLRPNGSFRYVPNLNFSGIDSFTYRPFDGMHEGNIVTVSIIVHKNSPTARDDAFWVTPDSDFSAQRNIFDVLANDWDADEDTLQVRVLSSPSHGRVRVDEFGRIRYSPTPGFVGLDTFQYRAFDGALYSSPVTVRVTVASQEPAPTSSNASFPAKVVTSGRLYFMSHDDLLMVGQDNGFLAGVIWSEGTVTVSTTNPQFGIFKSYANGSFVYQPNPGFIGTDQFTYTVNGKSAVVIISVVNREPTIAADTFTLGHDGTLIVPSETGVLVNDADIDRDPLQAFRQEGYGPWNGALELLPSGSFSYRPNPGFFGVDTFAYRITDRNDGIPRSAARLVTLNVTNFPPQPQADQYRVAINESITIPAATGVLSNDADPEDKLLNATLVTSPSNGTLQFFSNGAFRYVPNSGFVGGDSFTYRTDDGSLSSRDVPVRLYVVGMAPVAGDDRFLAPADGPLVVTPLDGILANDASATGSELQIQVVDPPHFGVLSLQTQGSFVYSPSSNFFSQDQFSYRVYDGQSWSTVARVAIDIPRVPPSVVDDVYSFTTGKTLDVDRGSGLLINDPNYDQSRFFVSEVEPTRHGTLSWNNSGAFSYAPETGFIGVDRFAYRVSDGKMTSRWAIALIEVTDPLPTLAIQSESHQIGHDNVLVVSPLEGLLSNDHTTGDGQLRVDVVRAPLHGTLVLTEGGALTYRPQASYAGADRFTYRVTDGRVTSVEVPVIIDVTSSAPLAESVVIDVTHDRGIHCPSFDGCAKTAADGDGDVVTVAIAPEDSGQHFGQFQLSPGGGFSYVPSPGFVGMDSYVLSVNDGLMQGKRIALTFRVSNDSPQNENYSFTVEKDGQLSVPSWEGLLSKASDANQDRMEMEVVSQPTHGSLVAFATGGFVYQPDEGYTGDDVFWIRTSDGIHWGGLARVDLAVGQASTLLVAQSDSYRFTPNQTLVVSAGLGLLGNDVYPAAEPPAIEILSGPMHGTMSLAINGTFAFTPHQDYHGTDEFTYRITVGEITSTATVRFDSDFSFVPDIRYATPMDMVLTGSLPVASFGAGTAVLVQSTSHGTVVLAGAGFSYTPHVNYFGSDSFTFVIGGSNLATVWLDVFDPTAPLSPGPNKPLPDAYSFLLGAQLSVSSGNGVLSNDRIQDATWYAELIRGPAQGILGFNADGSFSFSPASEFTRLDTFVYRLTNGNDVSGTAEVILSLPHAPQAIADNYTILHDRVLTVLPGQGVLANDVTADGMPLHTVLLVQPAHGELAFAPDGSLRYRPDEGYVGSDSFRYAAGDGLAVSTPVTVNLTVNNETPVAGSDSYEIRPGHTLVVSAQDGLLKNDLDANGDSLTISAGTPANGTLQVRSDGSFVYVPAPGFIGIDSFTYTVSDGVSSGNAVVSLIVRDAGLPTPSGDSFSVIHDKPLFVGAEDGLLKNDLDDDGDFLQAVLVSGPASGTLTLQSDGAFVYIPAVHFIGQDAFSYQITDGIAWSQPIAVTVQVTNHAPWSGGDSYTILRDQLLSVDGERGIRANDMDEDADRLVPVVVQTTAHGSLNLLPNGSFTYRPATNFIGTDGFYYQMSDGVTVSTAAWVNIAVTNQTPSANADYYEVLHDRSLVVQAHNGILANDADANGDRLHAGLVQEPQHGTLQLLQSGAFVYTPIAGFSGFDTFTYIANDGFVDSSPGVVLIHAYNAAPVVGNMIYEIPHGIPLVVGIATPASASSNEPGRISVVNDSASLDNRANQGIQAVEETIRWSDPMLLNAGVVGHTAILQGTTYVRVSDRPGAVALDESRNLLSQALDLNGDFLTVAIVSQPIHGTLTANALGNFVYLPASDSPGVDTFVFSISDGVTVTLATATIYVHNHAPTVASRWQSVPRNGLISVVNPNAGLLQGASDSDGDPMTAQVVTGPEHGTVEINLDGTFLYRPTVGYVGQDSFSFQASDGGLASPPAFYFIEVGNDAPIARSENYTVKKGQTLTAGAGILSAASGVGTNPTSAAYNNGVLGNDSDPNFDLLTAQTLTTPAQGQLTFTPDGSFNFVAPNQVGTVSFNYSVSDGVSLAYATVTISVLEDDDFSGQMGQLTEAAKTAEDLRYRESLRSEVQARVVSEFQARATLNQTDAVAQAGFRSTVRPAQLAFCQTVLSETAVATLARAEAERNQRNADAASRTDYLLGLKDAEETRENSLWTALATFKEQQEQADLSSIASLYAAELLKEDGFLAAEFARNQATVAAQVASQAAHAESRDLLITALRTQDANSQDAIAQAASARDDIISQLHESLRLTRQNAQNAFESAASIAFANAAANLQTAIEIRESQTALARQDYVAAYNVAADAYLASPADRNSTLPLNLEEKTSFLTSIDAAIASYQTSLIGNTQAYLAAIATAKADQFAALVQAVADEHVALEPATIALEESIRAAQATLDSSLAAARQTHDAAALTARQAYHESVVGIRANAAENQGVANAAYDVAERTAQAQYQFTIKANESARNAERHEAATDYEATLSGADSARESARLVSQSLYDGAVLSAVVAYDAAVAFAGAINRGTVQSLKSAAEAALSAAWQASETTVALAASTLRDDIRAIDIFAFTNIAAAQRDFEAAAWTRNLNRRVLASGIRSERFVKQMDAADKLFLAYIPYRAVKVAFDAGVLGQSELDAATATYHIAAKTYVEKTKQNEIEETESLRQMNLEVEQGLYLLARTREEAKQAFRRTMVDMVNAADKKYLDAALPAQTNEETTRAQSAATLQAGFAQAMANLQKAMATANREFVVAQADAGALQRNASLTADASWKLAEIDAQHDRTLHETAAELELAEATATAGRAYQEADKLATTQWVAALNTVQAQLTQDLIQAGNVLETAVGVAVRDWRSSEYAARMTNEAEATVAQRAFNTAFVAGASAFSGAETQAWADHASAVAMAQANRATGEASLFGTAQTMIRSARYFETQDWYIPQTTAWGLFRRAEQMAGNELQSDLADASRDYQQSRVQQGLSWTQTSFGAMAALNSTLLQTLATQVAGEDAAWASFATSANALTAARIAAENDAFETGLLADLAVDLTRENTLASAANTYAAAAVEAEATEVVTKVDVAFTRALAEAGGIHALHVAQADADQAYQQQERILSTTAGAAETLTERNTVVAIAISDTARQHDVWNATANYTATLVNAQKVVAQATESARGQFRSNMQVAEKTFAENVAELEAAKRLRDLVISYDTERIRYTGLFQRDIDRMLAELEVIRDSLASTHGGITPTSAGSLLTAQRQQEPILRREPGFWGFVEGSLNLITGGASREVLASPEFGRVLNAVDGFFAGWAHGLTGGLTTRLRSSVYGETASRNHSGTAFDLGNAVGEVHLMFLQSGNPCSMGRFAGAAKRIMSGLESAGGVIDAWDNIQQGNYGAAGLNLLGAVAGAFQASRACFSADTQLMVSGGYKRVDQFQENDFVFARNEFDRNGPIEEKRVEEVFVRLAAILELRIAGKIIRTTSEHPFDDQRRGWTPAGELAPGDLLSTADGRWVAVEQVTHTGKFEMVYNLRVADYHTYFVGGDDWGFCVWAHNQYRPVNANRLTSRRANHGYVISDKNTGEILKYGVSGGRISAGGLSARAQRQLERFRAMGFDPVTSISANFSNRARAVAWELAETRAFQLANSLGLRPVGMILP